MKRTVTILIAAILMQFALNAQDLKVISYNIRNSEASDGTNSWMYRYAASAEMIKDQMADVIGIQEALEDQIYFIEENFSEYKSVGKYTPIFWNKKTVSMQKSGSFDSAVWALMKAKKSGNRFYVVNIDLGETEEGERKNVIRTVVEKISEINTDSLPVVFMGGFYMQQVADVEAKMSNARTSASKTDNTGTYHNWGKTSRIFDHIFYTGFSGCDEYQTITKKYTDRKFISDHFPLMAYLSF